MYQALYRTWRPRSFDDVVGQRHITDTLRRQVESGKTSHAYLFTGTRGTGKTSCAKILSRAVNCQQPVNGNPCNTCSSCRGIENGSIMDVLELDAASNNGVDQIRALRDEAIFTPASVKKRVYIVDEVHMLTTAAFNALLKILEEPPAHLLFILATTELHKVPATIRSRCQQFSFKRLQPQDIAEHLLKIAAAESIPLTQDGAALMARLANGGMRDGVSLLDQCAGETGTLDEAAVLERLALAGNRDTAQLFTQLIRGDVAGALDIFARLYQGGREPATILSELSTLVRDLLIRSAAPKGGEGLLAGGYDNETIKMLLAQTQTPQLLRLLGQIQRTLSELTRSPNPRIEAELCLLRLAGVPEERASSVQAVAPQVSAPVSTPTPQPSAPQATPPKERAPQAAPKERAPQAELSWGALCSKMLPSMPGSVKVLLADASKVQGELKGNVLILYTDSPLTQQSLSRKGAELEAAAAQALSSKVMLQIKEGIPAAMQQARPAPAPKPAAAVPRQMDAPPPREADIPPFDDADVPPLGDGDAPPFDVPAPADDPLSALSNGAIQFTD